MNPLEKRSSDLRPRAGPSESKARRTISSVARVRTLRAASTARARAFTRLGQAGSRSKQILLSVQRLITRPRTGPAAKSPRFSIQKAS